MDPFAVVMLGILALGLIALVWLGLRAPGSGAEQLGWRTPDALAESEAAGDEEDLRQLLEATNRRRRARGEREFRVDELPEDEPK